MAMSSQRAVVVDAGPIIHLDELESLDLLEGLGTILMPRTVWFEVLRHRPGLTLNHLPGVIVATEAFAPSLRLSVFANSLALGEGEVAAISLLENQPSGMLLCDDSAARLVAESLGLAVHGTIGILIRSLRRATRTRPDVLSMLRDFPNRTSLHISRRLLAEIIADLEGG